MTSREKAWLFGLAALAILSLIEIAYISGHNQLLQEINNAGHIPVFGLLAIALLHLIKLVRPSTRQKLTQAYGAALLLSAILGVVSEGIQYFGPRDADLGDLGRDVIGAVSFLALYAAIRDKDLKAWRAQFPIRRIGLLALTLFLWLFGGWGVITWSVAFAHRDASFSVLCDFSSSLSTKFLNTVEAHVEKHSRTPTSPDGHYTVGTMLHFDGGSWPGVVINDVYPDWRGYDSIVLVSYLAEDADLTLGFSANDRLHNQELEDRFTTRLPLQPGLNRNAVSLDEIRTGPAHRELDMEDMKAIRIFASRDDVDRSVLLLKIWLK